jgi:hypothetical protein
MHASPAGARLVAFVCWATLALIAVASGVAFLATPRRNPQLAAVFLGPPPGAPALAGGVGFSCVWNGETSARRCERHIGATALTVEFTTTRCSARFDGRPVACRLSFAHPGYPAVQLDEIDPRLLAPSLWRPIDKLASLGECAWGTLATYVAVALPLALAGLLAARAEPLKRRIGLRLVLALFAIPPTWFVLLLALLSAGYID